MISIKNVDQTQQYLHSVGENQPIFARKNGKIKGMIVKEDKGWILRIGGSLGCSGFHPTRERCFDSACDLDFEFCVEN